MPLVYLSIGSNCGDRLANVKKAIGILSDILFDFYSSEPYETPDCKGVGRPYINAVASGETEMSVEAFEAMAKKIEHSFGRTPEARLKGDVPIDIDLVIYGEGIYKMRDFNSDFFKIGYKKVLFHDLFRSQKN